MELPHTLEVVVKEADLGPLNAKQQEALEVTFLLRTKRRHAYNATCIATLLL